MDDFSLYDDGQSLGTGFIIHPGGGSVSIITDDFTHSSDEETVETPLAHIIGRSVFSVFTSNKISPTSKYPPPNQYITTTKVKEGRKDESSFYKNHPSLADDFDDNPETPRGARRRLSRSALSLRTGSLPSGFDEIVLDDPRQRGVEMARDSQTSSLRVPLDFLEDKVKTMTFGRRIALALQPYKWYNPRGIENQNDNTKPTEIEESSSIRIAPSLARAWAYFEHFTLPRHVMVGRRESHKKSDGLEIANAGEQHFNTRLYNPITTPLNQMGDFGLGFGLYFSTLKAVGLVTFIAGLVSIPNIIYFSGDDYSENQVDVPFILRGSAVCTNFEYMPCLNCQSIDFQENPSRLKEITSADGTMTQLFALKNNCGGEDFPQLPIGLSNLAAVVVVLIGVICIFIYLRKEEIKFDTDKQTAQDYSIVIHNPPIDANEPEEWKEFFEHKFDAHMTCCTIVVDNEILLEKLVRRRDLLLKIQEELDPDISTKYDDVAEHVLQIKKDRNCLQRALSKVFSGIPEWHTAVSRLENEIHEMSVDERNVIKVFITFETEEIQRKVLSALAKSTPDEHYCFRKELFLKVEEPAEPSAVRWDNLNESSSQIALSLIIPFAITVGSIIAATFFVKYIREVANSNYAAVVISLLNITFPRAAKFLTKFEVHGYEGGKQTSLYVKISFFRLMNTVVALFLVTPFTSTITSGDGSVLSSVSAIFISELVTINLIQILDVVGNFKRHYAAPRAATQETMNTLLSGSEVIIAERYTNMTKILLLALLYSSIYPAALFICSFALFLNFYIDRFSLMRSWRPPPKIDSTISQINRRYVLPLSVGAMAVVSSYCWAHFQFDNLCPTDEVDQNYFGEWAIPSETSSIDTDIMYHEINESTQFYKFCQQNMFRVGYLRIPALPSYQPDGLEWMSNDQERLTLIFGWISLAMFVSIVIVCVTLFIMKLTKTYKPRGGIDDEKKSFSSLRTPAYIPAVESTIIPYPLVACPVSDISAELFGWRSLYHSYDHYDLTVDARRIMGREESGVSTADSAFSSFSHWPPPV